MRHRILILLFALAAGFAAHGQLTLEHSYDHSLTSTKINATEYRYYLMDVANSQCRIYGTDHSLLKTITISLPADYYLQDIQFVTENLFNNDASLELWYSAYNWVPVGDSGYYRYVSKVISEGTVQVFSITGEAIYKETFRGGPALRINTSGWAPGVYSYRIDTPFGAAGSRKLVIR